MALRKPKETKDRKLSHLKDKVAKRKGLQAELSRLVLCKGYKYAKEVASKIAFLYRSSPGKTAEEALEFETHCKILWAFESLFTSIEQIAGKTEPKKPIPEEETTEDASEW